MVVVIGCMVAIVALLGYLVVFSRRRDRAERRARGLSAAPRPDPQPVARPYDPALCTYCDESAVMPCPACQRALCGAHQPWPAGRFCYPCEAKWAGGARARALVLAPVVIGLMVVTTAAMGGLLALYEHLTGFDGGKLALGVIICPLVVAAPAYHKLENRMRRAFRPDPRIPSATARPRR